MAAGSQHYRRQPKGGIVVTERDTKILELLGEHRFLSSEHIMGLLGHGRHPNVIRGRLRKLFDHGYLHRFRHPGEDGLTGSKPRVYGLAARGAREVAQQNGRRYPAERRSNAFLEHALQVSDVLVGLELACRRRRARFIPYEEVLAQAPQATQERAAANPALALGWPVTVRHKGRERKLNLYPDAIFGLKAAGKRQPSFFCLEADRGTEPGVRKNLLRSSLYKKFLLYYSSWVQWADKDQIGRHKIVPPYGFRNPRVLTVVATKKDPETRIGNLLGVAQEVAPNAPGLFLFTTHQALVEADPLTHDWRNAKGKAVRLLG